MIRIETPIPQKITVNDFYNLHWGQKKRIKDLYYKYFAAVIKEQMVPRATQFPVEITYLFTFKGKVLDSTNLAGMAKIIEDSLVHNDILPDDSPKFVQSTTLISRKGNADKVEILIV